MDETLHTVLAALVTLSLAAIVLFVAIFAVVAIWTTLRRDRDPLAGELDRTLEEILAENGRSEGTLSRVPSRGVPPR